jgi:hypothetical protein
MKKNNLDVAPTLKELDKAGFTTDFEDDKSFRYTKTICNSLRLNIYFENNKINELSITIDGQFIKSVEPTKAAINAEFKHFNQPLPQWETKRPKVGEVWANESNTLVITPTDINYPGIDIFYIYNSSGHELVSGSYTSFELMKCYGYKKVANSLEQYYKEKFINKHMKNK